MGLCMSSEAARGGRATGSSPSGKDTALVLMPTGEMREYPSLATMAVRVLEDAASASASASASSSIDDWLLCDADGMGFEGPVAALRDVELLRAGQIYFVLPAAAARGGGLRLEEVAALAVRASNALSSREAAAAASGRRRRGGGAVVAPLVFAPPSEDDDDERREVAFALKAAAAAAAAPPVRRPAPRVRSGRRLEKFASDLAAIPECDATSE